MFVETTTNQKQKQMVLLLCFWDKQLSCVATKYIGSLFFARLSPADINKMFLDVMNDFKCKIPWNNLINNFEDGQNINKALCWELNSTLKSRGYKGLTEFLPCTLYTVDKSFKRGINVGYGEMAEQLVFDLYAWFKV